MRFTLLVILVCLLVLAGEYRCQSIGSFDDTESAIDIYLRLAHTIDIHTCGLRLVCELQQKPQESLQSDELLLVELFGHDSVAPTYEEIIGAVSPYKFAAFLGVVSKFPVCGKVFSKCAFDSDQIMESFRKFLNDTVLF